MDELDVKIIKLLEENGRVSHEEISKQLHISRPSVHQRVAKLEKGGVILGYKGIIDWRKLNQKIKAIIFVKVKCQNFSEVIEKIMALEIEGISITECQRIAGPWCLLLKIRATAPEDITKLIDEMVKYPEIIETSTSLILSTIYENGIGAW